MKKRKKKVKKTDLRVSEFRNGRVLMAKQLNDMWKDIHKLRRKLEKYERTSTHKT